MNLSNQSKISPKSRPWKPLIRLQIFIFYVNFRGFLHIFAFLSKIIVAYSVFFFAYFWWYFNYFSVWIYSDSSGMSLMSTHKSNLMLNSSNIRILLCYCLSSDDHSISVVLIEKRVWRKSWLTHRNVRFFFGYWKWRSLIHHQCDRLLRAWNWDVTKHRVDVINDTFCNVFVCNSTDYHPWISPSFCVD